MNAAATDLLFNWEPPRRRAGPLTFFIAGSLGLHALCFYLFQIVYPPSVALIPPPARVSLISNQSEDGRAFLRWLDAEDPSLVSTTIRPFSGRWRELPRLEHVPSYMHPHLALKLLPPLDVDLSIPSVEPPGAIRISRRKPSVKTAPSIPTIVEFSEEFAPLGAPTFAPVKFNATSKEQPQNVRFRVAVDRHGKIQFTFPLNSSGDAALDGQARTYVARAAFPHSPNEPLLWGIATIEWGSDIARPEQSPDSPARSTSTPSP